MLKPVFLWRVTLLCNLCYLISLGLRIFPSANYGAFQSTILIMGTLMALLMNVVSLISIIILLFQYKSASLQPAWLLVINFLLFLVQLIDLMF